MEFDGDALADGDVLGSAVSGADADALAVAEGPVASVDAEALGEGVGSGPAPEHCRQSKNTAAASAISRASTV